MSEELASRIVDLLASTQVALSTPEIAERLEREPEDVDRTVWERPYQFAWQPGHRWALTTSKRRTALPSATSTHEDARAAPLAPRAGVELRAMTLTSGVTLRVSQCPIDSSALFYVNSRGNELQLVLNSSHPIFASYPMPFVPGSSGDFKALLELLLEAWALSEDGAGSGQPHRHFEETRMMWGRRMVQLLAEAR